MLLRGMAKPSKTKPGRFIYDYEKLGELAGLTRSGVYKVGRGDTWPSPDNLDRIAKALKVSPSMLFFDPESDVAPPITFEQALEVISNHSPNREPALQSLLEGEVEKSESPGTAGKTRRR